MAISNQWLFGTPVAKTKISAISGLMDAWNIPGYLDWLQTLPPQDRHLLLGDNRKRMLSAFGRQSVTFVGEFRYLNWVFENGFAFATAARKGSVLEVPATTTLENAKSFSLALIDLLRKVVL